MIVELYYLRNGVQRKSYGPFSRRSCEERLEGVRHTPNAGQGCVPTNSAFVRSVKLCDQRTIRELEGAERVLAARRSENGLATLTLPDVLAARAGDGFGGMLLLQGILTNRTIFLPHSYTRIVFQGWPDTPLNWR